MKVGKKVLSCVLAIMMIVSSVSVCFSVLGADNTIDNLMTRIEVNYSELADLIARVEKLEDELANATDEAEIAELEAELKEAEKQVPRQENTTQWKVDLDTGASAWHWVAAAYSEAAKVVAATKHTYYGIYAEILEQVETAMVGRGSALVSIDQYDEVLKYFAFGETAEPTGGFYNTPKVITLYIGLGFNVLEWAPDYTKIPTDENDLKLYNANVSFKTPGIEDSGYGLTEDSIVFTNNQMDSEKTAAAMLTIKESVAEFVQLTAAWFAVDFNALTVDELNTKVKEISDKLYTFENAILFTAVGTAEEIWNAYVTPNITPISEQRDWDEIQAWYKEKVNVHLAKAYAAQYKSELDALYAQAEALTEDANPDDDKTLGDQLYDIYTQVVEVFEKIDNQEAFNGDTNVNIADDIIAALGGDYDKAVEKQTALATRTARQFASEWADEYDAIYDTAVVDAGASAAMGHIWAPCDGNCGTVCDGKGNGLTEDDGYNGGDCTYGWVDADDDGEIDAGEVPQHCVHVDYNEAYAFFTAAAPVIATFEVKVFPLISDEDGNVKFDLIATETFNESNWRAFYNNYLKANRNINGSDYIDYKAKMDTLIGSIRLTGGMSYKNITTYYNELVEYGYEECVALSKDPSQATLFEDIFGEEGMAPYDKFVNDLKRRAANRIYEQLERIKTYYEEGGSNVTYYNFEAILSATESVEVQQGALFNFLRKAPAYDPTAQEFVNAGAVTHTLDELEDLYTLVLPYSTKAQEFKDTLALMRTYAGLEGGLSGDKTILNYLFDRYNNADNFAGRDFYDYMWVNGAGKLDYDTIKALVNELGLGLGAVGSGDSVQELMDQMVAKFDKMLISNDLGSILEAITANSETGQGFLGEWGITYTFNNPDGSRTTRNKGDKVQNLREMLINLIIGLLYGGTLQNLLMSLYGLLGNVIMDLDMDIAILGQVGVKLPEYLRAAIPLMPHWFTENWNGNSCGQTGVLWKNWFDGTIFGSEYNYSKVLEILAKAPRHGSGTNTYSFWDSENRPNFGTYSGLPTDAWDTYPADEIWHVTTNAGLYRSLAAASCGLAAPLGTILCGEDITLRAKSDILSIELNAIARNIGDPLYDRLLIPLYELLGITAYNASSNPHGYRTGDTMKDAAGIAGSFEDNNTTPYIKNYGVTFWEYILDPLLYWMETELFVQPVQTILGLLPNLLGAIEYNQILPKIKNIALKFLIDLFGGISLYDLKVWDLLSPMLDGMGLKLDKGFAGIIDMLLSATRVDQTFYNEEMKKAEADRAVFLKKNVLDAEGNKIYDLYNKDGDVIQYNVDVAALNEQYPDGLPNEQYTSARMEVYRDENGFYYTKLGLLTQTLFSTGAKGCNTGLLDTFTYNSRTGQGTVDIGMPVNRIMSMGSLTVKTVTGCQSSWTNYHLNADSGDVLLALFRWLMNDGVFYKLTPLLNGMLATDTNEASSVTIIDTILPIIDGQADTVVAILISLLNEYTPGFYDYKDTHNVGGFEILKTIGAASGEFVVGQYLSESLADIPDGKYYADGTYQNVDGGVFDTDDEKIMVGKVNRAIKSIDDLIMSLLPTLIPVLLPMLEGLLPENMAGIIEPLKNVGENDTLADIIADVITSNGVMQLLVTLLVGTGEQKTEKDEDGNEVLVYEKDENGDFVLDASGNKIPVMDTGLLGGLLGEGILANLLTALADFDIDIRPVGFYNAAIKDNNTAISNWLAGCRTSAGKTWEQLTWADIKAPADDYNWFYMLSGNETAEVKIDTFFGALETLLTPLNPLFSFLFSGQDITLLDELVLEGNPGYTNAMAFLIESLGYGDVKIAGTNYTASMSANDYLTYVHGSTNPEANKTGRNWNTDNSPLSPLFAALRAFLVGDDASGELGLLESPLTALLSKLPNIAYLLYSYETTEKDESGAFIKTNNLAQAAKNLISPVLALLNIVDPILARALELDIESLLDEFLNLETMLNELITGLVKEEDADANDVVISNFIDFAALASYGSDKIERIKSNSAGTDGYFTYFQGNPGQALITIVRSIMSDELIESFADMFMDWYTRVEDGKEITDADRDDWNRVRKIVTELAGRAKEPVLINEDEYNGTGVDILVGILVDVLTDYVPGEGIDMFYQTMASEGYSEEIMKKYGIYSTGYDWLNITKDGDDFLFTKEEVGDTLDSFDAVLKKALPDIIGILTSQGILDLSSLGIELEGGATLYEILTKLVEGFAFTDEIMTTIVNLLAGLFGGTIGDFLPLVKDAGVDITAVSVYKNAAANGGLRQYMAYGIDGGIDANGQITVDGKKQDITWADISDAHGYQAYEYDEHGNVVMVDGQPKLAYAQKDVLNAKGEVVKDENGNNVTEDNLDSPTMKLLASTFVQETKDGKFLYTYKGKDADGKTVDKEYLSEFQNLESFAEPEYDEDGNIKVDEEGNQVWTKYTLKAVYTKTKISGAWSWNFDDVTAMGYKKNFYGKVSYFITCLWEIIGGLDEILEAIFFGKDSNKAVKLFDTLNIEGQDGFEDTMLPLLRGLGLDSILSYLNTTPATDSEGNDLGVTMLEQLNNERKQIYGEDVNTIPANLLKGNQGARRSFGTWVEKGTTNKVQWTPAAEQAKTIEFYAPDGYDMEIFLKVIVNYVFYFVEILASYPITTLMNLLPTLAYFVTSDGLTQILSNLLTFVTVLTDRLAPIVDVDVNTLGGSLIDVLATDDWSSFQEVFTQYIDYDENGNLIQKTADVTFTESIVALFANMEIDLTGLMKSEEPFIRTITYFTDGEADAMARAMVEADPDNEEVIKAARDIRTQASYNWLKSVAALAKPFGESYTDADGVTHNIPDATIPYDVDGDGTEEAANLRAMVKVDAANGQLEVDTEDVFMFILDFVFENTTMKEVLGALLGYDLTDENGSDAEFLDELLTNVFRSPDSVVDIIVALFTTYDVAGAKDIDLIAIDEYHYNFYDEDGSTTYQDILPQIQAGTYAGSEISRVKTAYAIDNLDKLVGTVLNLFKADLVKEGGLFHGIFTEDDDINLKAAVNGLLEDLLFTDDMINDLLGMLVGLLAGEGAGDIIGIVTDILKSAAGIDISPEAFANNPILHSIIMNEDGTAKTWSEIAKENTMYEYKYQKLVEDKDGNLVGETDDKGEPVYAAHFDVEGATTAVVDADGDGEEDDKVNLIKVWNQRHQTIEQHGEKKYVYYFFETEDDQKNDVRTEYFHTGDNETEYVIPATDGAEEQKFTLTKVMEDDTDSQKTAVKFDKQWNIVVEGDSKQSRLNFVTILWDVLEPLAPVLGVFLTGENLSLYGEITIRGFDGYEGVILPLINALGAPVFEKADGTKYLETYYATQEEYEAAIYGYTAEDDLGLPVAHPGDTQVMLQAIIDAVFALVDSLCDRPMSTLLTLLPYLARFLESNGIDTILGNLLSPVTALTDMIKNVYDLDIMGLIKGLLQGLAADMKQPAVDTATDYVEEQIDEAAAANANAGVALAAEEDDILNNDSGIDLSKLTFMDIIWDILEAVQIDMGDGKKLILSDIITDRLFVTLASCAWYDDEGLGYVMIKDIDLKDGENEKLDDSRVINTQKDTDYYVDRETVLLAFLDTVLFQESVRDLIAGLIGDFDFSDEALKDMKPAEDKVLDTDYLPFCFTAYLWTAKHLKDSSSTCFHGTM